MRFAGNKFQHLGGQVEVTFAVVTTAIEYIRAGKLRALAVTSATRQEALPNIPLIRRRGS